MANTKSAKKMVRKIARRTEVNKSRKSRVRTFVRKVEEAVASGDKKAAITCFESRRAGNHALGPEGRASQEHRVAEGLAPRRPREGRELVTT
jgi:hypothetical protein